LFYDTESLVEVANGELYRFMDRVGKGLADGRFPKGISAVQREAAMREFSTYFVTTIFQATFGGDVAALRGKQLNLLKSACEILYKHEQAQEWAERGRDDVEEADDEAEQS
jgi:CRISPR-associated protein Csc3